MASEHTGRTITGKPARSEAEELRDKRKRHRMGERGTKDGSNSGQDETSGNEGIDTPSGKP